MTTIGGNISHEDVLEQLLRLNKTKRERASKDIDTEFNDIKDTRIYEGDTYDASEVEQILDGLRLVLKGVVEEDVQNIVHINVQMVKQILGEVERHGITIPIAVQALEDKEMLKDIEEFERMHLSAVKEITKTFAPVARQDTAPKLQPISGGKTQAELMQEIQELKGVEKTLNDKVNAVTSQFASIAEEKNKQKLALTGAETEITRLQAELKAAQEAISGDEKRISALSGEVSTLNNTKKHLEGDLAEIERLTADNAALSAKLEELQAAAELKLQNSPQFINLKKMLDSKSKLAKDLKDRLSKYETVDS